MMKLTLVLLCLWAGYACATDLAPEEMPLNAKGDISGPDLEAILTALPELARHNLDYRKYRICVCTQGDQLFVLFSDLDKSFGRPGHAPTLAGVKIDLSPDGKTVTGFEWQR